MSRPGGLWRANPGQAAVNSGRPPQSWDWVGEYVSAPTSFGYNSGSDGPVKPGTFGYNSGSETESTSSSGMRRRFDHVGEGFISDDDGDGVSDTFRTAKGDVRYTRAPAPVPVIAASVGGGGDLTKWLGYAALAVVAVLVVRKVKRLRKRKARGVA